jgi:hypothetical protein
MSHVDMTVGIGGTVMEKILRLALSQPTHLAVDVALPQNSSVPGSRRVRSAFIGNAVFGRFSVSL